MRAAQWRIEPSGGYRFSRGNQAVNMENRIMLRPLALAVSILICAPALAETKRLTVGDPAPPLTIEKWVRGDSVGHFEPGKVYVVEFWATWCGPCVRAIPHLTELHNEYQSEGVTFIASTRPDKRNTLEKVEEMVRAKNAENLMTYTVAWDGSGKTRDDYMLAADFRGIPAVFVVDQQGRIAFIGRPHDLDRVLHAVVGKTWDLSEAKSDYEALYARESRRNRFFEAMDKGDTAAAYALAPDLINYDFKDDAGTLNGIAWEIVDPDSEITDRNLELAMRAAVRAVELEPTDPGILDTYARVLFLKGETAEAIRIQELAIRKARTDEERADLKKTLDEYAAKRE